MALIALYARATGRTYAASHALLVIVLLMLVWNPLLLAFDPGFGLSVAATAGLIWLTPLLEFKFSRVPIAFWRDIFATTVAAQIAVLPLLLYQMGLLSLVAIPANLLIAAVMPFAMGLAALAGLAGVVLGHQGWLIALPAYILTTYIIAIAEGGRALPFAALQIPALPFAFVFAAYAALIYLVARKRSLMTFQLTFSKKAST
jgi:competence protein ComEC